MEENNFDVICRSSSSENNGRINDCHSSTNSSDEIPLDNYQQFPTTWTHQENPYPKDSRMNNSFSFFFLIYFILK